MSIRDLFSRTVAGANISRTESVTRFLNEFSLEVMPRTASKIEDFRSILPGGTRVYIVHLPDSNIEDMVSTARRLTAQGFSVMPHFPARAFKCKSELAELVGRYRKDCNVNQALLLAGGCEAAGEFTSSMDLLETGLFDSFKRLHVAGHPEGCSDVDSDGSDQNHVAALQFKQAFSVRKGIEMAIVTQFCFDTQPVIAWANRLKTLGITLPIHIGVPGPAKLNTLMKFALSCGVGPSIRVLQRRAADVTNLLLPFEPTDFLADLAQHKAAHPDFNITNVHFFPLGGIKATTDFAHRHRGAS